LRSELKARLEPLLPRLHEALAAIGQLALDFQDEMRRIGEDSSAQRAASMESGPAATPAQVDKAIRLGRSAAGAKPSSGTIAARLLTAMQHSPRRDLTWSEAAILAVVSPISGPTRIARNQLLAGDDLYSGTPGRAGAAIWVGADEPLIADDVVDAWRAKLGGMAADILGHLFCVGPDAKDLVAEALGRSPISGPWRMAWKKLRNNLLVEERDGKWRLAAILRELPRAYRRAS
jgi:hypothetical protein